MGERTEIERVACARGFMDKTPTFMKERQRIVDAIDMIYKRHGAEKLETPALELKEVFSNKRNTCNKLLDLDDQGGEILALRYDLKHPLTRYLSMNKIEKHMKISQSGYVYRKDKIELDKFRLREFFVSDFDICGPTDAMVSEVQCLRICCDIIGALELNEPIRILVGHRRVTELILRIASNISDTQAAKLISTAADDSVRSAINWNTIATQIGDNKITESVLGDFRDLIESVSGDFQTALDALSRYERLNTFKEVKPLMNELIQLKGFCQSFLSKWDYNRIRLDFNLIGSGNFYTGLVFATQLTGNGMNLLSGGHYDNLIAKISPKPQDKIGCTGFSIGVDQLVMYRLSRKGLVGELFANANAAADDIGQLVWTEEWSFNDDDATTVNDGFLKNAKGMMDRSPQKMLIRERVFSTIIACFQRHNAHTIDTPLVERHDVLAGKYGEDSKMIYDLNNVDGERLSLRYDLTVPFARYLTMHPDALQTDSAVFKRYQIGKVYRRDNPSMAQGRYREFYQCDFDMAGESTVPMGPDIETIQIVHEILRDMNLGTYKIKINHRKLLDGLLAVCGVPKTLFRSICSSIDKLDKTPWDNVYEEMLAKGLPAEVACKIGDYVGLAGGIDLVNRLEATAELMTNIHVRKALVDMRILLLRCSDFIDKVQFDLSLARGLDYYTGLIYEAVFTEFPWMPQDESEQDSQQQVAVGSVSGGGRYDNLVNMFSSTGQSIPCVGLSIGVERLMAILEKKMEIDESSALSGKAAVAQVMVITAQKNMIKERFLFLSMLLDAGISATHSMKKNAKALDSFQECERKKIPLAVIIGQDELKEKLVKLRFIESRVEEFVLRSEIIERLQLELNKYL